MTNLVDVGITVHDGDDVARLKDELLAVYQDCYYDKLRDPFFAVDRFWQRLTAYASRPGFAMTVGRVGNYMVGYACGFRLPADTRWWEGLTSGGASYLIHENGNRTFGVNEIMVRPLYRRQGIAGRLHDKLLLATTTETRATLLVEKDNTPAISAYRSWGYQKVGDLQPFSDAPTYDAMVKDPL